MLPLFNAATAARMESTRPLVVIDRPLNLVTALARDATDCVSGLRPASYNYSTL
jgi:hypothetical protein